MANFLQNVDFLEDFPARILIFDIDFVNAFDCDVFTGEFVDAECDFAESTLAQEFDKPVEFQGGVGYLPMLFHISLDVSDQLFSVLGNRVI